VRIVHGKGLSSPNREPVLKAKVRKWLQQRDEVLAYCEPRPHAGGGGAVVVLLSGAVAPPRRYARRVRCRQSRRVRRLATAHAAAGAHFAVTPDRRSPITTPGPVASRSTIRPTDRSGSNRRTCCARCDASALRRGEHVALVLDRPRAQQDFPVRGARRRGERRRHDDQRAVAERAIQLGKAQVVADESRPGRTAPRT
jgi:hypothetical protein